MNQAIQTLLLASIPSTIAVILAWLLSRNGANQQLKLNNKQVDANEDVAEATVFDVQIKAYQDLMKRAQEAAAAAEASANSAIQKIGEYDKERKEMGERLDDNVNKLEILRVLFARVIKRSSIEMTVEEQEIFDATKPTRRHATPRSV